MKHDSTEIAGASFFAIGSIASLGVAICAGLVSADLFAQGNILKGVACSIAALASALISTFCGYETYNLLK